MEVFGNVFNNKKVLVTGNTGFKGSWLTAWLLDMGAEVHGISKDVPTQPVMFEVLKLEKKIKHSFIDIRDFDLLRKKIMDIRPDFIFHMAAQPIVSTSYAEPLETLSSNVMGTANIMESIRELENQCVAVMVTSDKCYENLEHIWGYKESDQLGGKDIYSGSKGMAELAIHSYFESFFKTGHPNIRIASARAGNVMGGGDWAKDRLVVDCMEAWSRNEVVTLRKPNATRPWQHVLEPLSGYLQLAKHLHENFDSKDLNGESFNFGPRAEQNHTVLELLTDFSKYWDFKDVNQAFEVIDNMPFDEAGLLKLNIEKAQTRLNWNPNLVYADTIKFTSEWYHAYYKNHTDMFDFTLNQIDEYEKIGKNNKLSWTHTEPIREEADQVH
jgi:CDP-glucose 4,6-dehydratase